MYVYIHVMYFTHIVDTYCIAVCFLGKFTFSSKSYWSASSASRTRIWGTTLISWSSHGWSSSSKQQLRTHPAIPHLRTWTHFGYFVFCILCLMFCAFSRFERQSIKQLASWSIYQINHSIVYSDTSTNQPINQSTINNWSINRSIDRSTNQLIGGSIDESISKPTDRSWGKFEVGLDLSINQWTGQSASLPINYNSQPANQSI